jgi:hypothetical protein
MATVYKCDRCGAQCTPRSMFTASVLLEEWQGEWFTTGTARLEVSGSVGAESWEDVPDLCDMCIDDAIVKALEVRHAERRRRREERQAEEAAAAAGEGGR